MLNRVYAELLATGKLTAEGGLSAKTVRYVHTPLHKVLADAVDADLIGATLPTERSHPDQSASAHESFSAGKPRNSRAFSNTYAGRAFSPRGVSRR